MSYCSHVLEYSNPGICKKCGDPTHDINWKEQISLYVEYKKKVGFYYNTNTWWSI